ncbi:GNAT family N-acetyltransferase [Acidaminobacter sp. JC074]|uniref:GNAT family N-acetyltransferase n=1 Tax=Acidaminobacter sp. JC074 TaxID=2530199 RepID=UPI001F0E767E|nr:GNAT family N-acetyltransferase [Acidaminobacter sp. JC074]MCH4886077.1 GNAT family N-acetyltransferase [Acidaminobacter sp. JC074]
MNIKFDPFPVLKTERLTLTSLSFKHEGALFDYQSNKENFPYVDMPIYKSIDEAKNYIIKMKSGLDQEKWINWAICLDDDIIGTVSIWNLNHEENKAEVGYGIFPAYRRHGYMKEALLRVIDYAFDVMELDLIEAYTSPVNIPSTKFLEDCNFDYIKSEPDPYSNNQIMSLYKKKKSS